MRFLVAMEGSRLKYAPVNIPEHMDYNFYSFFFWQGKQKSFFMEIKNINQPQSYLPSLLITGQLKSFQMLRGKSIAFPTPTR